MRQVDCLYCHLKMMMKLKVKRERPLQHEYWMLPKVPFKVKLWQRIPRTSRYIPFGYEVDPEERGCSLYVKPDFAEERMKEWFEVLEVGEVTKQPWNNLRSGQFYIKFIR